MLIFALCSRIRVHEWGCWQTAFGGGVPGRPRDGRRRAGVRHHQRGSGGGGGAEPVGRCRRAALLPATAPAQADAFPTARILLFKASTEN